MTTEEQILQIIEKEIDHQQDLSIEFNKDKFFRPERRTMESIKILKRLLQKIIQEHAKQIDQEIIQE
jgi:hypothetical protein